MIRRCGRISSVRSRLACAKPTWECDLEIQGLSKTHILLVKIAFPPICAKPEMACYKQGQRKKMIP
jgi:hypothetical protein